MTQIKKKKIILSRILFFILMTISLITESCPMENDIVNTLKVENIKLFQIALDEFKKKGLIEEGYVIDARKKADNTVITFRPDEPVRQGRGNTSSKPMLEVIINHDSLTVIKVSFVR